MLGYSLKSVYLHRKSIKQKDWVNWSGEVPQKGDVVLIHFGDNDEEEYKYRVVGRIIDGGKPEDVDIIVSLLKF